MASRDSKQKVCANYSGLLIDTGATSHIVRDNEKFVSFNGDFNPDEHTIELADGTQSHAAKQGGRAKMIIKDAHRQLCKAELQNALLVPGYPCDIFSVNAAMQKEGEITFSYTDANVTTQVWQQL